jgi:uncharacterized protein YqiB (DUF1249 family)
MQNHERIPDPYMEMLIFQNEKCVEVMSFQNGLVYYEVYTNNNPRIKSDLNDFLTFWLKNSLENGYQCKRSE